MMIIYLVIAFLYGLYSVMRQWQRYSEYAGWFKILIIFLINSIAMPISIIIALIFKVLIPTKEEHYRFMFLLGFKKYRNKK